MALLGYTIPHFKQSIPNGTKTQTIRKLRKLKGKPHPIKLGERLYHYFGLRTKHCEKLGESICNETFFIRFYRSGCHVDWFRNLNSPCMVMRDEEIVKLAHRDGFNTVDELFTVLERMHGSQNGSQVFQVIRW